MKRIIVTFAPIILLAVAAHAAPITWQAAGSISGTTDVITTGTYFGSWAPFNANANATPINGVTFQGFSDLPSLSASFPSGSGGPFYGTQNTTDSNYNGLLTFGVYAGDGINGSFSWNGMTLGHTYLIQLWVADARNIGQTRWENLSSGVGDNSPDLFFPADGTGNGHFAVGTFVADATGAQAILIDPSSNNPSGGSAQVNLVQVRDLGVVPEPATAGLLMLGLVSVSARRRRETSNV
jgi:hypothetical protein